MATATNLHRSVSVLVLDHLDMLVTNDPVAELDAALATATAYLQAARQRGDSHTVERLTQWINHRLDQRNSFNLDMTHSSSRPQTSQPACPSRCWSTPART